MVGLVWVDGGYFKQIKNTSMAYNGSGITLNAGFVFHCNTFCFMFSKILSIRMSYQTPAQLWPWL